MAYNRPGFFGGFQFFPPVIKSLLIANGAVFLGMMFLGNFHVGDFSLGEFFEQIFALRPIGNGFAVWQLFTYMFMHANFTHILFNMLALWMFGMELEHVWGSRKFFIYYLLCGFGGGLANLLIAPMFTSVGPTVGASGAIYGVLLAFGMMFPERPIYVYFLLPIKAKYFVVMYMAFEIFSVGSMDGVAHFAHLGGAIVGFVYLLSDGYRFDSLYGKTQSDNVFTKFASTFKNTKKNTINYGDVTDAKVYNINDYQTRINEDQVKTQKQIDDILDKISKDGYQSLNEERKENSL